MIKQDVFKAFKDEFLSSIESICIADQEVKILVVGLPASGKRLFLRALFGSAIKPKKPDGSQIEKIKINSIEIIIADIQQSDNLANILPPEEVNLVWYFVPSTLLLSSEWHYAVLEYLQNWGPVALNILLKKRLFFQSHLKKLEKSLGDRNPPNFFFQTEDDFSGIKMLLDWSFSELSTGLDQELLAASSIESALEMKKELISKKIIPAYSGGAGAIGAVPIPFSDTLILIPIQIAMTVNILKIFGLEQSAKVITGIISTTFLSQIGRMLSGSLIKLLPGGVLIGSTVNASIAASLTFSLGSSINEISYQYCLSGRTMSFDEFFRIDKLLEIIENIEE